MAARAVPHLQVIRLPTCVDVLERHRHPVSRFTPSWVTQLSCGVPIPVHICHLTLAAWPSPLSAHDLRVAPGVYVARRTDEAFVQVRVPEYTVVQQLTSD